MNRNIFILWFQGWDNAPWLQQQVKNSWIYFNPNWNIHLIDDNNLKDYVNDIDYIYDKNNKIIIQTKSDIIRLSLLKNHGGVWADATCLCMKPLDNWIDSVLNNSDFWMYHGSGKFNNMPKTVSPCIWFIISKKNSYIINKWKESSDNYWKNNNTTSTYFWLDTLFKNLFYSDTTFQKLWLKTKYINCSDYGSSSLYEKDMLDNNPKLKNIYTNNPPHVLKFSSSWNKHCNKLNTKCINSNGYHAIKTTKVNKIEKFSSSKTNCNINKIIIIIILITLIIYVLKVFLL